MLNIIKTPSRFLRKLYDWTVKWSNTRNAPYALFIIAFVESSFFPIPPDVLLIAMTVAAPKYWLRNAAICTLGSVTGAALGYYIGFALYETVGRPIVDFYHLQPKMELVGVKYEENALFFIFTAAFTPIPFKIITIAAGVFHQNVSLPLLLIGSAVGRAGRFFLVAGLLRLFGQRISHAIEKYFDIFSLLFVILLVGGFFALKYVK